MDEGLRLRESERAVKVGLAANAVLAVAKTTVGLREGSQALLVDGVNSTADVIYFVAALILVRAAAKEPDQEHPYGHWQTESIASLLVGAFIITTAVVLFYSSVSAAITAETKENGSLLALGVAVTTIALKTWLVFYTTEVARGTGNVAIGALGEDHRNDIYATSAVVVGIGAARLGYAFLDPVAGAVVSFFILAAGISVVRTAIEDLMGTLPRGELADRIRRLTARVAGVDRVDEVRAYRFGPYLVLHIEIQVAADLSVEEGHTIATDVEQTLVREIHQVRHVYTHVNPAPAG